MTDNALDRGRLSDEELVRSSDLFDADYYLTTYPDVAAARVDPVKHYLGSGAREGRDPSSHFSSHAYVRRYRDVQASGWNPLVHFLRLGEAEGRLPNPILDDAALVRSSGLFDEAYYRHFRPDIAADVDVVLHYLEHGAEGETDPSEQFSTAGYLRQYPHAIQTGMNPLVHYLREGLPLGRSAPAGRLLFPPVQLLEAERWPRLQPFSVVRVTGVGPRVTVLADRIDASDPGEGVDFALLLGTFLANKYGASLRIATTHEPPDAGVLGPLQRASGLMLDGEVELAHVPYGGGPQPLVVGGRDLVVTTSWWTTRSALDSTLRRDEVVYLLQDDERAAYPPGDERLLCSETLARSVTTVVKTEALLKHLASDLPRLAREGFAFEPAFPPYAETAPPSMDSKRQFYFSARPGDARYLFWRGVTALARALEDRVLDPEEWTFHFVGAGIPKLSLPFGVRPEVHEGLDRLAHQALVARMDAGMVLMDAPNPSHLTLDLAASGVAVLTNRDAGAPDLSDTSRNIVAADASVHALVEGLGRVAALGADEDTRRAHCTSDSLSRDWSASLAPVAEALLEQLESRLGRGGHVH